MCASRVILASALLVCLAAPASATVTVTAFDYILTQNTPGQVVQILISSDIGQGIQIADLGLQVGDGLGGPIITDVDMTSPGTVFGDAPAGNIGQSDFEAYPTWNQLSVIATNLGDTPAAGVLANVTVDTTGLFVGIWQLGLTYAPFSLPTSTSSFPPQQTVLIDGRLILYPEPSSLGLALLGVVGLGFAWWRRGATRRRT